MRYLCVKPLREREALPNNPFVVGQVYTFLNGRVNNWLRCEGNDYLINAQAFERCFKPLQEQKQDAKD